jgi:hypothetical protein
MVCNAVLRGQAALMPCRASWGGGDADRIEREHAVSGYGVAARAVVHGRRLA